MAKMVGEYGGRRIGYFMCEATEMYPHLIQSANRFDEVWTASTFCQEILQAHIDPVVKLVPHHASGYQYCPTAHDKPRILISFDAHSRVQRKNPIQAIQVVKRALGDACKLIIKCKNVESHMLKWMYQECEGLDVTILNEEVSPEDMSTLYKSIDVYLGLHTAEGFGLQLLEAMALGKKVVATNYGGNTDFMNDKNSFPVGYKMTPVTDDHFIGEWAQPDLDDAVDKLREAVKVDFEINQAAFETALNYSLTNTIRHTLRAL
jgi:glycosyltransferase involved in cell wall biosynthesis